MAEPLELWTEPVRCSCGATCEQLSIGICAGDIEVDEWYNSETEDGGWIHRCTFHMQKGSD